MLNVKPPSGGRVAGRPRSPGALRRTTPDRKKSGEGESVARGGAHPDPPTPVYHLTFNIWALDRSKPGGPESGKSGPGGLQKNGPGGKICGVPPTVGSQILQNRCSIFANFGVPGAHFCKFWGSRGRFLQIWGFQGPIFANLGVPGADFCKFWRTEPRFLQNWAPPGPTKNGRGGQKSVCPPLRPGGKICKFGAP
jgi:hypothetical protein